MTSGSFVWRFEGAEEFRSGRESEVDEKMDGKQEKRIAVIVDGSGSMAEIGKRSVVKCIYQVLCGSSAGKNACDVYLWGKEMVPVEKITDFSFSGRTDAKALEKLLETAGQNPVLFISDGCFGTDVKKAVRSCSTGKKDFYGMLLGGDGNRSAMESAFGTNPVFEAEDIAGCLHRMRE